MPSSIDPNSSHVVIGPSYPALPGVALAAPSIPIQFSTVSPLDDVSLPTRVEQPLMSPVVESIAPRTESFFLEEVSTDPFPSSPPPVLIPESLTPSLAGPISEIRAAPNYLYPNELLVDTEHEFDFPDAPTDIPFIFPEAPAHLINLDTEASTRGLEAAPSDSAELSHRTVAMSGPNPNRSNASPNSIRANSRSVSMNQPQLNEEIAYPTLPSLPAPRVVATSMDSSSRSPSIASVSSSLLLSFSLSYPRLITLTSRNNG
jgi:hypothetical protein